MQTLTRTSRCLALVLGTLVAVAVLLVAPLSLPAARQSATQQLSPEAIRWHEQMAELARRFELHPELKTQKGSGWKPYNRLKWFYEQRMVNGELPPWGARWAAWERKRELETRSGLTPRATWFELGPKNMAGRMLDVAFHPSDPNIVYAGSASGGAWKTTDAGGTWFPISDELPSIAVGGIAVSPLDPDIVVVGTGEGFGGFSAYTITGVGILRSTDAGATWLTTSLTLAPSSGHGFHDVEAGPNGTFLAAATDGLWRSDDSGDTWTQVRTGGDYYDIGWKPGDPNTVFTCKGNATGSNVKVSTDDGVTWTKAGTGQPSSGSVGKTKIALTAADPNRIYALYGRSSGSDVIGFYRSTDGGATWNDMSSIGLPTGQTRYNLICAADPNDADVVIVGAIGISRSTDGGVRFTSIGGLHVDHHFCEWQDNDTVWEGNDGGVYLSTDDGVSFAYRSTDLATYQFYDICVNNGPDPYYIMGGTQDNGTNKWSGTSAWSLRLSGDGMVCNIDPMNGTTVYAERQRGDHVKNTNSGEGAWQTINTGIPVNNSQWVVPVAEDQNAADHLYTHHSVEGIYRTTDGGSNWVNVAPHKAFWIDISRVDGDVVWTTGPFTWFTTDDGGSWTQAAAFGFPSGSPTKILAHPTDVNTAWVTFSGYVEGDANVVMTTDMGASWADVSGDFPDQPVNAIAVNPSDPTQWFIGTDVGVWVSVNGGLNWMPFEVGLPNVVVTDLEIKDSLQKLVAATYGRGAWELDIPPVNVDDVSVSPGAINLMLDRPWPNPALDRTLFRFAAKHEEVATLRVYDVQGRLVSDLGEFAADGLIRTIPWFPDDVSSGVYFVVLRAGDSQKTQKLIIRK